MRQGAESRERLPYSIEHRNPEENKLLRNIVD